MFLAVAWTKSLIRTLLDHSCVLSTSHPPLFTDLHFEGIWELRILLPVLN